MPLIYEPKGKAREYSPLGLNVYSDGCDHGCKYCYCADIGRAFGRPWTTDPKARSLRGLEREAAKADRQILLSFVSDPYCSAERKHRNTRTALTVLRRNGCSTAILTKGGTRCLDDLDAFCGWPDARVKVGATLTFMAPGKSEGWEPGAAAPSDRIAALRVLHESGVKTWASIEPVIEPDESLAIIGATLPYVDAYKVGRWNHDKRSKTIDWTAFGMAAVGILRAAGKAVYVKDDLRSALPPGFLTPEESDADALALPDRSESGLFA